MNEKTLKFNNIILNKKEFHKSKEPIDLFSVNVDQISVSDKFEHNNEVFKHQKGEIDKLLCIILPQMIGCIKYFENGGKIMSFLIKDNEVWNKYDKIWEVIKDKLGINFYSKPVYEHKYLLAKVREFDGMMKKHTCIAYITIDSVLTIDKKNIEIQKSVNIG